MTFDLPTPRMLTAAAAALLLSAPAHADATDFAGFHVGLGVGAANIDAGRREGDFDDNSYVSGRVTEIAAGYSYAVASDFVLGAEVEARQLSRLDDAAFDSKNVWSVDETDIFSLRAMIGHAGADSLAYMALGYESWELGYFDGIDGSDGTETLTGASVALGFEYLVAARHGVGVELKRTDFDRSEEIGPFSVSVAPKVVDMSLNYRFRF